MDDATHQRVMDPYELPDDILAELNRLNQLQQGVDQQKEHQHHLQQLNQQQLAWQAQQPHYGQQQQPQPPPQQQQQQQQQQRPHQQQSQQQQQQLHQHNLEPEVGQQQLTESRMLGHNPEVWLFPESASSEPATASDIAQQNNRPIQKDHSNDCLPNQIIADLTEYFPSGGLEAPEDISMEIDPIEAGSHLMSVEQRDSLKETRNLFHEIDGTNNPNPNLLHEASFVNMVNTTTQQAGYLQYIQQQAHQLQHQPQRQVVVHSASQPAILPAPSQPQIPLQGVAATDGVLVISADRAPNFVGDQNVPPTIGTQRNEVQLAASIFQQGVVSKRTHRSIERVTTSSSRTASTKTVAKKDQKSQRKRRPSNTADECSTKSAVPGQRSPYHHLHVQVHYKSKNKIDETISDAKGGVVFFKSIKEGLFVEDEEKIELPLLDTRIIPGETTLDQIKYTNNNVVKFVENGVHLLANESGIFATRYCRGKVNFWSTDCGETEMETTIPLPRNDARMIFNYQNFKKKVERYYKAKKGEKVPVPWYPTVVLTFSQNWNIRSRLGDILVSAIVEPVRAQQFLDGLFVSAEVKPRFRIVKNELHSGIFDLPSIQ